MRITIEEEGYVFSREWEVDDYGQGRPTADDAVDAALFLLSRIYPHKEVEESARLWEF